MSTPNAWAKATVLNNWGGVISNVQLKHRYDNEPPENKSWDSIADGEQGNSFDVGYWTGFGRTGYDYWLVKFEADGKVWTCKDNFYCFLTDADKGGTVVCRVYSEGDSGKMEVICPQSSSATVALSSQQVSSVAGERTQRTATCDGTLVPGGVLQRWRASVLAGLKELQERNKPGTGCQFGVAGDRFGRWDKENWALDFVGSAKGDQASYVPRTTPFKAVGFLVTNLHLWTLDCATYAEVALLVAWRHFLRTERAFDAVFNGLVLKNQHSSRLPMEAAVVRPDEGEPQANFNAAWDCAIPGTKVSWRNRSSVAAGQTGNTNSQLSGKEVVRVAGRPMMHFRLDAI